MKINGQGVVLVVSHLIITLAVIVLYFLHPDETLRNILTLIVGYWFGSMGASAIMKNISSTTTQSGDTTTKTESSQSIENQTPGKKS